MKFKDIIVIGGGASGMMAAAKAAECGSTVLLIEKMERIGRKVRITGKGRCNITNMRPWNEFSTHIFPKNNFFKSAFYSFSNVDTVDFFEKIGLKTILERGERVYPASEQAKEVVEKLEQYLKKLQVEIMLNTAVKDVTVVNGHIDSIICEKGDDVLSFKANKYILATGGLSYPLTGSTGDGYNFAKLTGHKVNECFPSLTALMPTVYDKNLSGLNLKNCAIKLIIGGNIVQDEFGDIDFTDNGLEGPLGLRISRKAVKALMNKEKVTVEIDLKSALDLAKLKGRIEKELTENEQKTLENFLRGYLPAPMINPILKLMKVSGNTKCGTLQYGFSSQFANSIKSWRLEISGYTSYERAVITAGGVDLNEIIAKNMKSKICENLYFAGELIDLDGDTGGYNLQIAFSTGALAGHSAAHSILTSGNSKPSDI